MVPSICITYGVMAWASELSFVRCAPSRVNAVRCMTSMCGGVLDVVAEGCDELCLNESVWRAPALIWSYRSEG